MKKLLLCIALTIFGLINVNSQEQVIKANPIGLAFGVANVGYEFSTNESQTLTIAGVYYNISDVTGFGGGLEYRFYFAKPALKGWHAGPSVAYLSLEDDYDNSAGFFTIGGEIGHQWIFGEHFALDVFAGLVYITGNSDDLAVSIDSVAPSLGVSIGYAW